MHLRKSTIGIQIVMMALILFAAPALSVMQTFQSHPGIPGGADNFEIEVGGECTSLIGLRLPKGYGWNWTTTYNAGTNTTTIVFSGENFIPEDASVVFGVDFGDDDIFRPESVSWSQGETLYPIAISSDTLCYFFSETMVTAYNPSQDVTVELVSARYKTVATPIPLAELDYLYHPPCSFTDTGITPTMLLPGETLTFSIPVEPDYYAVLRYAVRQAFPGTRGEREGDTVRLMQIHTSEMITPAASETWSGVKVRYE